MILLFSPPRVNPSAQAAFFGIMANMRNMNLLVAGASSGIGRAVAIAAAARGARCVLAARRTDELERTRALMANPEQHVVAPIDFADADGRDLALMRLFTAEGPFDGVAYTVGVCPVVPLARLDAAAFDETMRVNCGGFVALMRAFAARGAHAEEGSAAVAVSSVSAREGWAGGAAYCASKGALSAVARALAAELAPKRIRVEAIEPSYVLTDMFRNGAARMGVPESAAVPPETVAADILDRLARNR